MVDTSFFINNGPFTLQQVAEICEAELQNAEKAGVTVNNINTMEKAGAGRQRPRAPKSRPRPV